jgi:hypothetical protein
MIRVGSSTPDDEFRSARSRGDGDPSGQPNVTAQMMSRPPSEVDADSHVRAAALLGFHINMVSVLGDDVEPTTPEKKGLLWARPQS